MKPNSKLTLIGFVAVTFVFIATVALAQEQLPSWNGGPTTAFVRAYPTALASLRGRLSAINTPVQIISGRNDPFVPLANAQYLISRLPNARHDVLECGHLVWEDEADAYARIVCDWAGGGYQCVRTAKKE